MCGVMLEHACINLATLLYSRAEELWKLRIGLNIYYFIYTKRDWAEHRCYVEALSQIKNCSYQNVFAVVLHQ